MKKLLIIVMACYGLNARAQVDGSKNFIYLFSDSLIYANKIRLHPDFYGKWQVRADSRRIPNDRIKFFNNEDGFFANTRLMNPLRVSSFSERIIEGRINLYQQTDYGPAGYGRGHRYGRNYSQSVDQRMFYNKGFGDLKKVTYNNLQEDMSDHPESMDLLNAYRKSTNTSKILYAAAGVSAVAGLVSFIAKGKSSGIKSADPFQYGSKPSIDRPNFGASFLLLGFGAGFAIGGFTVQVSGYRNLENAVETYNR